MTANADSTYIGNELELFSHAQNWKRYWCSLILPFLRGGVLEVGAGMGTNTRLLRNEHQQRWVCLEPDGRLLEEFEHSVALNPLPQKCEMRQGTIGDMPAAEKFDALIYIDVLEHYSRRCSGTQTCRGALEGRRQDYCAVPGTPMAVLTI